MRNHPLADVFPRMNQKQFDEMKADIEANGLQEKIVIFEGQILDGRHRYRACVELGWSDDQLRAATIERNDIDEPAAFVMSANQHRRHMTQSQRAMVAARMVTARRGGRDHAQYITVEKAARTLETGEGTVRQARTLLHQGSPQDIEDVEAGRISLGTAHRRIKQKHKPDLFDAVADMDKTGVSQRVGAAELGISLGVYQRTLRKGRIEEDADELKTIVKPKTERQKGIEAAMRRRPFRGVPIEESGMPAREEMTQPDPNHPGRTKLMAHVAEHGLVQLWSPGEKAQHDLALRLTELTVWLKRMVEGDFYFPTPADLDKADALTQKRFRNALARYLSPALTRLSELEERMRNHLDTGAARAVNS